MTSWEHARSDDGAAVRRAIREAATIWQRGDRLDEAVQWLERASAIAESEGQMSRAVELATHALELRREAKRRSGMPAPSDPAWDEARRIQSSLIDVRDSWLELSPSSSSSVRLDSSDLIEVDASWPEVPPPTVQSRFTVPDVDAQNRAQLMMDSAQEDSWFDEDPTLPQRALPQDERDTLRPPLGSFNELTLMMEFEVDSRPSVTLQVPASGRGVSSAEVRRTRGILAECSELKGAGDEKLDELLRTGTLLRLNERALWTGWDAAVVLWGAMALLEGGRASHRFEAGDTLSGAGAIFASAPEIVAIRPDTQLIAWSNATLGSILGERPKVRDALRARGTELQTMVAIRMGRVARCMGETFANSLWQSSRVVLLAPGALVVEVGIEVCALNIVGLGGIELVDSLGRVERASPGEVLFADELMSACPAPMRARASREGATVLHVQATELHRFLPHTRLLVRALSEAG